MYQTLLVSGASGGLGLSLAIGAAKAGYRTYAAYRDTAKIGRMEAALAEAGVSATILPMDVQDMASIEAAVARILGETGRIDVLVNNAGAGFVRTLEQATEAEIDWALDVNLKGVMRSTKAVLPAMRAARSGRVVTISSVGGLVGQPFNEVYCAAKFGVEGFMEALATYVGPAFGLHFTVVEPGGITSDFNANAMKQFASGGGMRQDEYLPLLQSYVAGVQARAAAGDAGEVGNYQTPDEVAEAVLAVLADPNPPVRVRTSGWAENFSRLKTSADPDGRKLRDSIVARYFGKLPL